MRKHVSLLIKAQGFIFMTLLIGLVFSGVQAQEGSDADALAGLNKLQVTILDRQIFVNDRPYRVRGVTYQPVPKGSSYRDFDFDYNTTIEDIAIMKQINVNTIRTYFPIEDVRILDAFASVGIRIIMGFAYYDDRYDSHPDMLYGGYKDYIEEFKAHPAIIAWNFGNEYNYHPEWFGGDIDNWYSALEEAAQETHRIDPGCIVSTAHGEVPYEDVLQKVPSVDVWGLNVYRWDNPQGAFDEWKSISNKPMYLSESGGDSYDNNTGIISRIPQVKAIINIWKSAMANSDICAGVTFMEFNDEWWKMGNPNQHDNGGFYHGGIPYDAFANEEHWGLVTIDREFKPAAIALKAMWLKTPSQEVYTRPDQKKELE